MALQKLSQGVVEPTVIEVETMANLKSIHVAVGVIIDSADNILIALRPAQLHQGGLWEFPGGKVEAGETVESALARELLEELAISVSSCQPLIKIAHDYVDKSVLLDVWWVRGFSGEPRGAEGQPIEWVGAEQLGDYRFPEANIAIVEAIQQQLRSR
ncbi:MAG: 8-oxo-dGTP diphosphatase [Paraglaciecola psychrophila]